MGTTHNVRLFAFIIYYTNKKTIIYLRFYYSLLKINIILYNIIHYNTIYFLIFRIPWIYHPNSQIQFNKNVNTVHCIEIIADRYTVHKYIQILCCKNIQNRIRNYNNMLFYLFWTAGIHICTGVTSVQTEFKLKYLHIYYRCTII